MKIKNISILLTVTLLLTMSGINAIATEPTGDIDITGVATEDAVDVILEPEEMVSDIVTYDSEDSNATDASAYEETETESENEINSISTWNSISKSATVSGASNYDKSSGNDSWCKKLETIVVPGVPNLNFYVYGNYFDKIGTDTVATYTEGSTGYPKNAFVTSASTAVANYFPDGEPWPTARHPYGAKTWTPEVNLANNSTIFTGVTYYQ